MGVRFASNWDAVKPRPGLPPVRLGSFHLPRRAHDLPVGIGMPSRRQAAFSPISMASILKASLLTVVCDFVVFGVVVVFFVMFVLSCLLRERPARR
jgi:hypothetical protein